MSKSLQKGIIFAVCVALVLALSLTLVFFAGGGDKNILSAPQGQVSATAGEAQNNVTYTHGSNINRQISGTVDDVDNAEKFLTAVENNRSMRITNSFELTSNQNPGESQVFRAGRANGAYSGTIYGQGYTISFSGIHPSETQYSGSWTYGGQSGNFNGWSIGGLVNTLNGNGAIYDLNVVMKSGSAAIAANNDSFVYMGVFAGALEGNAKVENCTLTINGGGRLMVGRGNQGDLFETSEAWLGVGGLAGRINGTGVVINNVTVSMDQILLEGGQRISEQGNTDGYNAMTGMLVGMISTNATINNIRLLGSFGTYGSNEAKLGVTGSSNVNNMRTTINFYDDVKTTGGKTSGVREAYASESGNAYVTNIYKSSTSDNPYGTNVGDHEIFFDPTVSDSNNSLAVVFTGQPTIPSGYKRTYTLTSATGKQYTNQDNFIVSDNGATVVAKGLPSATSNWNSNGTFTAKLTYEDTPIFQIPDDPIPVYEHGYVPKGYSATTDSKEIKTGAEFTELFRPSGSVEQSGSYYLSEDIAISGFTGNTFNGTLDGCGHTIYIIDKIQDTYTGPNVGGLVGNLGGTIKNVRVVLVDEAGEVSLIKGNTKSNRIGVLVGKVNGGTLENVQVVVESGATLKADMTTAGDDHDMAMGGVVGGTNNATLSGVTMELNGKLDPHGSWTFVGAMAGKIEGTTTFENVVLRGNGTLAGHATNGTGNSGQPVFAGALGVTSISSTSPTQTVTVNGLIYDFDVNLAGTMRDGAAGDSNGSYSCYYLLTNNYNDGMIGGDVTEIAPISQYNGAASYSNVFIASDYVTELEGYAKFRTNGNAPIGGATINKVMSTVDGATGSDVTAYFNPVDGENDMIFRATGSWMMDDMVQLVGSDGTLYQSAMEVAGDHSSPKLVYAPKGVAATINVVQLTMPSNVLRPEFGSDVLPLTYNGQEQSFVFTLKLNNADQTPLTEDDFTVTYRLADASTGSLGSNSLPVNAGEYIATIVLKNGYKFIAEGQGTETDTYELTVEISPYTVEINSAFDFDAAYGEIGLNGDVISGGKFTAENLFANYDDLLSTFGADNIPGIAEITVAAADSSQITASGAGKLPVGSYTVAAIKLDDTNFAATDYVEHLIAFEVTKKSVSAQIAINKDLPDAFTGSEFDLVDGDFTPTFTTLESGDVVTLEYLINDGALTIYNAGEYVFTAKIADGGDGGNYSLGSYEFAGLTDNKHTVGKYTVTGSWAFADGAALVYGTPVSDPSALITTDFSGNTVTVDESMVEVEVFLEATDEPWKENMPAGTEVTVVVNITFNDTNFEKGEITAPESDRLTVQKRTIGVTDVTTPEDPYFPLMSVEYGSKEINSDDTLTAAFNDHQYATGGYITDIYKDDQPEFVVKLYLGEDADDGSMVAGSTPATWSDLNAYTGYVAVVELADAEGNYVMDKEADHFVFQVAQKEVIVTGVTLDGFDGEYVFDGKAHNVVITISTELVGDDTVADILTADVTSVTNAGDHIIVVNPVTNEESFTAADNYAFTFENGSGDSSSEYTITIDPYDLAKATVTIKESGLVYTGSAITVTPIVKGGENDFTSKLTVVVNGGDAVVNAGEYTITASGDTENSGNFTGEASGKFEVAKKQLKLESLTLSSLTYTGAPITVADHTFAADFGPADGEQPELSIVEETGATVQDAGTYTFDVTLKEASTYPVNANYVIAADGAKITATVSPATVTVTAGKNAELGALYGENATAETERFYESDFITLSVQPDETFTLSSALTFTVKNSETQEEVQAAEGVYTLAPGTYIVTYTINNIEGANYTLTAGDTLTTTLTVEEGALKLTITGWNNTSPVYNGKAQLPTPVFADSAEIEEKIEEGALVYEVTAKEGALTGSDAVNAGSYTVKVSIAEGYKEKYELVSDKPSTDFTIAPATLNITQTAEETLTRPYDGTTTEATSFLTEKYVTITGGVSGENIYGMLNASLTEGGEIKNAGAYTITVTFNAEAEGAGNYSVGDFTSLEIVYTVTAKTITITFDGYEDLTYNGQARTLTATADFVSGESIDLNALIAYTGDITNGEAVNAGSYTATITKAQIKESNANYTLAEESATQEFTISPATLTLTQKEGAQLSRVYDGTVIEAGAFVSETYFTVSGYVDGGDEYALFTAAVAEGLTIQNADSYTINITINSGAEGAGNYVLAEDATVEFTIAPKSIGVAWENTAFTYNGSAQKPNATVGEGLVSGDDLQITVSGAETDANTDGGSYTATAEITGGEDMGNYVLAEDATVEFTIARKTVSVAWENTAFTYNGLAQVPTANVGEAQGLITGDDLQITVSGAETDANTDGGSYTATAEITGGEDMGNYVLAEDATVEFTISRKTVSVAWDDTELTYNGSAQAPTAKIAEDGLIGEDEVILTVNGEQTDVNTSGGSYTATAEITGGADKDNYVLDESSVSTSFTIAPKPITITFTSDEGEAIEFDVAGSVTVGAWTADGSNKATLTLSDGTTDITLTVEASEALPTVENVPALWLLLDSKFYEGTPYGTKVEGGSLTVVSADTNYVFEGAQEITINITPAISVGLKADVETERGLTDVLKTAHNADYFKNNYFKVTGKDGAEVTDGTLEVTITPSEGLEEGAIKHAGTYTVTAVYTPKGAEESAERPTYSFDFIVTPVEVKSVTYSGESLVYGKLSASGEIAVTVEYANGTTENVTAQYTSENVSTGNWLNAGDTQVTVNYTGDDSDYAAVTEHKITVTVEKKTITATINYGEQSGTELTLTYNGSVGYTIGAELNDVLSGDGVGAEVLQSFIDVAAYEVEITLDGNDKDNYTVEGEYTVTITPADVTYKWNFADGAKITYGDSVEDVTALAVMPDGALLGVEGKVAFQVSVGDYSATTKANTVVTFDVSYTLPEGATAENYNINITAANGNTLTVGKATLNLTIAESASLTKVYDGDAVTLNSLLTAGNVSVKGMKNGEDAFTLGILAISGTDEMTNAGAYSGSVSVIDDCNYTAEPLQFSYKITPKPIGVAWSNTEFTYDGTAHKPTATATDLVDGDSLTLIVTGAETNAGSYTATVEAFEQGNYKLESDSTRTFTIKKAAAELAIKDYDAIKASVYKGSAFVVTPLLNGAEDTQGIVKVEFFDKTNSSAIVAVQEIKNAGTYTVTLTVNNANYEYAKSDFTVTVSPKSIGVKWTNTEFIYNGSAQAPTATATGLVGGDSLTLNVTGAQTNAGSYTATVKAASVTGNYKLESDSTQTFTIKKADLTVTPASLEIRERETEVMHAFAEGEDLVEAFAGRISVSGVSGTVRYTVTIAGDNNYDDDGLLTVGAHTFTIDAGSNYNAASVSVTVIATPVVTVIASVEGELVYNGSAFEISYALKAGAPGDVSMDDITVTASVETIVNAGKYEVTFTVTGSNKDYDYVVQDASGNAALTFTVAKRGLDVAEVAEAVYGNLQVSGTLVTGTHTAFVAYNDEEIELIVNVKTAALSRAAAEYLDAGEYEVTIALANEQGNFSLNGATLNAETEKMEVESTLDVAPKTVTVGYTPSSPVYDAKGISITLDKFEGMLIEGDDPAVNIYINDAPYTGKVVLDAGEYTVRYESADPNYAFAPVSATFTIAPKSVTPNFDLNTGSGSQQITGGGKLEIEEGEETDIIAAIDNFMQSSGVPEEDLSISVSGDLKLEDMASWAPGTYKVTVALSGNHSGSIEFTVEVSEKIELPPPVQPELPETPVEAGSGNDWVLPLVIAIVALIDLALLVAIGVAAKKRA